jgi:cardiolipin synthase
MKVAISIPNLLSLLRMGLVPLFVIFITRDDAGRALVVFAAAGLTDALDGFIARFWHQQTLLGAYLDPAADKLLLTTAYVTLSIGAINPVLTIPLWVTILVIARDVLIITTVISLNLALGVKSFRPAGLSKVTTGLQVVAVVLVLAFLVWPQVPFLDEVAIVLIYAVAVFTVASGLNYIVFTNRMVAEHREGSS